MPTHFTDAEFQLNFPTLADVFPTAQDLQNYLDAIFFNKLAISLQGIENYLITYKANIEASVMDSFSGGNGVKVIPVPVGRYPAGRFCAAVDSNLIASNIKNTIEIFGVTGNMVSVIVAEIGVAVPSSEVLSPDPVSLNPPTLTLNSKNPVVHVPSVTSP